MSEVMWDSTTAADIPSDVAAVQGYANGLYAWSASDWARFPTPHKVRTAVSANVWVGDELDVERGDATIDQAPGWVAGRQARGIARPWLYVDRSNYDALRARMGAALVGYRVADWTGVPHMIPGADAVQYANPPASGGHYDLSLVTGTLPCDYAAPLPVPHPTQSPRGSDMLHSISFETDSAGNGAVIMDDGAGSVPGITSLAPAIPWSSFMAATIEGSDPAADGGYWPGTVHVQERGGNVLVSVTGARARQVATVFVLAAG